MEAIKHFVYVINLRTIVISIVSVIATFFCGYFSFTCEMPASLIGIAVVLPTVGNYVSNLNEDGELDKDYKELPDYIKNNKYYTKLNGRGVFFPKGFEIGTFFSNIT